MDWSALFKIVQEWGPSALTSFLVVIVLYLIKKIDKHSEDDSKRAVKFQADLASHIDSLDKKFSASIQDLKADVDTALKEQKANTEKALEDHNKQLLYIKTEYIRNDFFLREISGWKEDISRLSSQISYHFTDVINKVIELWKDKK